jgi:hypothetical protein
MKVPAPNGSTISSRWVASSALRSAKIFFFVGCEFTFLPNRDAVPGGWDSAAWAGVNASRTCAGSSSPDILPACYQLGALLDESDGSPGICIGDVTGYRKNIPILLQRTASGNASATVLRRLDHQHPHRHSAYDPVANKKVLRRGKRANPGVGTSQATRDHGGMTFCQRRNRRWRDCEPP